MSFHLHDQHRVATLTEPSIPVATRPMVACSSRELKKRRRPIQLDVPRRTVRREVTAFPLRARAETLSCVRLISRLPRPVYDRPIFPRWATCSDSYRMRTPSGRRSTTPNPTRTTVSLQSATRRIQRGARAISPTPPPSLASPSSRTEMKNHWF